MGPMHKVMRQNIRVALGTRRTHNTDIGGSKMIQPADTVRDPMGGQEFRIIIDSHNVLGSVFVGRATQLIEGYLMRQL